jgi:glutamine synthetase
VFSDLEGRLHMLDYDKKFILGAEDNLTFDGSSIRGFTAQSQSDLRLKADWATFRWLPSDLFGAGKVLVFGNVCDKDGTLYQSDFRSNLAALCDVLRSKEGITVNVAPEIEGFFI